MSRPLRYALIAIGAALVLFVGGPWVYINLIRDEAPDSFLDQATATTIAVATTDTTLVPSDVTVAPAESLTDPSGAWQVAAESQVGYRVDEVLFGQNVTAVGRTNTVTGEVVVEGIQVVSASFEVDMTTITSDEPKRDAQFASRIMDTLNFPTSSFVLDTPITLADGVGTQATTHAARGTLTLRGTSKPVDVTVVSTLRNGRVVVVGEIEIIFAEWEIPNPSIPGISTEDRGILEFNLVLER
jgi:polyisoprenoid-binding protein YceI